MYSLIDTLLHTLAALKTNELADTLRDVLDHSLLDKLGDVGAKTLVDSTEGTIAESKVEAPCNTLSDMVDESLVDTLGDVLFMLLTMSQWRKRDTWSHL